ncbi:MULTISPECIES: hypothetical protein [Helicobacter]|nr:MULTISPECIES: hypothetical protein [Helicobacter]
MKIKINSYCLECLLENHISTSVRGNRLKIDEEIVIPEAGFME